MASSGQKQRGPLRIVMIVAGVVLTVLGLVLLVVPGPGIPVLIVGLMLLGKQIPAVARLGQRVKEAVNRYRKRRPPRRLPAGTRDAAPPGAQPLSGTSERPVMS